MTAFGAFLLKGYAGFGWLNGESKKNSEGIVDISRFIFLLHLLLFLYFSMLPTDTMYKMFFYQKIKCSVN